MVMDALTPPAHSAGGVGCDASKVSMLPGTRIQDRSTPSLSAPICVIPNILSVSCRPWLNESAFPGQRVERALSSNPTGDKGEHLLARHPGRGRLLQGVDPSRPAPRPCWRTTAPPWSPARRATASYLTYATAQVRQRDLDAAAHTATHALDIKVAAEIRPLHEPAH